MQQAGKKREASEEFDPVAYINEPRWQQVKPGLERITELMGRLGDPQEGLRIVHVAGTNGKGSTCAYTASILRAAGFRVGLFTSPYIIEFSERIRIDGESIPSDELMACTRLVRDQAEAMAEHPTEFELMTAVALVAFARARVDFAVLEVGLGGRLDSTNVVSAPEVCAIAPIALDHTAILGGTIGRIAGEKAGIIKHGATVVSAPQEPDASEAIRAKAQEQGCAVRWVDAGRLAVEDSGATGGAEADSARTHSDAPRGFGLSSAPTSPRPSNDGDAAPDQGDPLPAGIPYQMFSYGGFAHLRTRLLGSYQPENAALAIEAVLALRERGFSISDGAIRAGVAAAAWPGRFEIVAQNPTFIVDGGHNPQGARVLADSLRRHFPGRKAVFIIGVLADKDYPDMLAEVFDLAEDFVLVKPPNPRALPLSRLCTALLRVAQERGGCASCLRPHLAESFPEAVRAARAAAGARGIVCAFGSLYSIKSIMDALAAEG
ncbi:bifunctional folylpolyglutamate synthase/dihydrofolate synthase [Curtanaerobium respiraculi]|uniref:bifunctional folylpolyglutamate synthase/dihydrofolate synthase n=1 Tax=Curtanaerobium respiraculi TaxID=2949669 RepID=UPI0024B3660F|nr:folylpolyglutamate synthase/dihydrofolate synthase family protein [Curtanaerobium respiraculi]